MMLGSRVGKPIGCIVGNTVGCNVGIIVGAREGVTVGATLGVTAETKSHGPHRVVLGSVPWFHHFALYVLSLCTAVSPER